VSRTEELLINFEDNGKSYSFSDVDFQRVEEYCENECLGIQFLISANILKKLVKYAQESGKIPPYSLADLSSDEIKENISNNGEMTSIEKNFGTTDLGRIAKIVAKQTYGFIRKT